MFELRAYQQRAVSESAEFLRFGKGHGLVIVPTGGGKSLVIARIATALGGPCLVFQPTKEILEQNASKFLHYGYEPSIYSASMNKKQVGDITLATIGSVRKHPELFSAVKTVIVDEAHLVGARQAKDDPDAGSMYEAFFKKLGTVRILGLTATPYRLHADGYGGSMLKFLTRTRPRVFTDVAHLTQVSELVKGGYWSPLVYQRVPGFSRHKLKFNSTGADYTDESVHQHFDDIKFREKTVRVVNRLLDVGRKHILVFTRFVDDSEDLAANVPGVAVVTGETPAVVRRGIIDDFRAGAIRVVVNVGVLGIGFDYPELDTVVLARPTLSLALYYQQVGRAVRPHPAKPNAWIIDMVGLTEQFGPVENLTLQATGKRGQSWEIVSTFGKTLTNVYMGDPQKARNQRGQFR